MMARPLTILRRSALRATSLAIVVLTVLILGYSGHLGSASAVIDNSAERIVDLLMARSPDRRTTAELTKSKGRSAAAGSPTGLATPDSERMLGKTFPPDTLAHVMKAPEELLAGGHWPEQITELPPIVAPVGLGESQFEKVMPPRAVTGGPGWIGGGIGAGSSGGSSGGGESGAVPTPPVAAPIPEPATWSTLALGALLCAGSLRRRNRRFRRTVA